MTPLNCRSSFLGIFIFSKILCFTFLQIMFVCAYFYFVVPVSVGIVRDSHVNVNMI
jgi:hypothetical protein